MKAAFNKRLFCFRSDKQHARDGTMRIVRLPLSLDEILEAVKIKSWCGDIYPLEIFCLHGIITPAQFAFHFPPLLITGANTKIYLEQLRKCMGSKQLISKF